MGCCLANLTGFIKLPKLVNPCLLDSVIVGLPNRMMMALQKYETMMARRSNDGG